MIAQSARAKSLFPELEEELVVDYEDGDDPVLLRADGSEVDTWRENYPYRERLDRARYELQKRLLQIELLKLQYWIKDTGQRMVVLFEGRDAAGKGGTIKRFTEHLNPRGARVVALGKPTDREQGEWYFQRYVNHLPTAGEMVLFDRSWYNRAGVERVMGYCSDEDYERFLRQVPQFERMLVDDGVLLVKLWFSVSRAEQRTRFLIRQVDPVRQWKLSANDLESLDRWDAYTEAKVAMFRATDTGYSPWTVVKSNDKKRARIEAMRSVLARYDYADKDREAVGEPDLRIIGAAATLLEEGEDESSLSPTPIAPIPNPDHGPGLHPEDGT
ncbi:polyphosphate kinase 2 [Actinosynnema pretiosum subsp. pretiosum]|uniref:ADP/GDP-polyphosphate phosphotransferase n=1 Tax=Actinosynnema pretiosum subsp. pretiosum TaxID=103721 RepID=A0AA45R696_9PSEU|nr:Polyphosphate kinase 2 [Actinosynnema pretiosum subsp. pretiosum]QUF06468.1 polyphosphate kinase 2 [Actinosynnema pretiosum subsp. pretiosum]